MKILSIETSCDETAISIIECEGELPLPKFKVLANSLLSQIEIHQKYGGVYPMLAKREHIKNLPILLEKTLREAKENDPKFEVEEIDFIAVTRGPGLEPALWTGITFAEELGKKWGKRVIPVNHMEGHLFSFLFDTKEMVSFPAIALLVSGGHTELVLMESFEKYKVIGKTRDDAVGEAFDKTARLLGLPYPGGPEISKLAEENRKNYKESKIKLPTPMIKSGDFDFSYSGLKTSVLYLLKKLGEVKEEAKQEIARAFEDSAIAPLVEKTKKSIEEYGARSIIVGGGVSANKHLQRELRILGDNYQTPVYLPNPLLTTDNAVMIAMAGYIRLITNRVEELGPIEAEGRLDL